MTAGEIAALVAAGAFVVLVLLAAIPLVKLGRTLDEATIAIRKAHEGSEPLLNNANTAIDHVNTQLERVDGVSANVSTLTSLFTATMGGPLVKLAAFSYGLSRALRRRRKKAEQQAGGRRRRRSSR